MFEKYLVENCAPTLASLKTANLFRCKCEEERELRDAVAAWNELFRPKGVEMAILKVWNKMSLIYLYRKERLATDLRNPGVSEFLHCCGYESTDVDYAIEKLSERMRESETFPHEIGLFLSYPLGDVIGFIDNKGENCLYCGYWKVYCDKQQAICTFRKYRKCHDVYCRRWREGYSIMKLTVAG